MGGVSNQDKFRSMPCRNWGSKKERPLFDIGCFSEKSGLIPAAIFCVPTNLLADSKNRLMELAELTHKVFGIGRSIPVLSRESENVFIG